MTGNSDDRNSTVADFSKTKGMVRWFTPKLLAQAGFHSVIAGLFGRFADQRTIQQLDDPIPDGKTMPSAEEKFIERYDYSSEKVGGDPFWVDYTCDLGDGFDSTYAVAYTMGADALYGEGAPTEEGITSVRSYYGDVPLEHGRILVMGGDEVYPWPSTDEYEARLLTPFRWALPAAAENPVEPSAGPTQQRGDRDVFAIPGNHDWYDGLAAFENIFCRARNERAARRTEQLGGWDTRQHRSYFAIKLPYNWWIWGVDTQLGSTLDAGQLEYFRAVSGHMKAGDNFIVCTAQPSWYYAGTKVEHQARRNLEELVYKPIANGAKLCGLFSGDTHHYARYNETDQLGNFNLFTVGGGGAYTHGTRHLKPRIEFGWMNTMLSFSLTRKLLPIRSAADGAHAVKSSSEAACYPSKAQSRRLAWGNYLFPFRNKAFALSMGAIYWLLTWTFARLPVCFDPGRFRVDGRFANAFLRDTLPCALSRTIAVAPSTQSRASVAGNSFQETIEHMSLVITDGFYQQVGAAGFSLEGAKLFGEFFLKGIELLLRGVANSPSALVFLGVIWCTFYIIADGRAFSRWTRFGRLFLGTMHFFIHLFVMWSLFSIFTYLNHTWSAGWLDYLSHFEIQTLSFSDVPDGSLLLVPNDVWVKLLYPLEMVLIGGIFGGLVFGWYLLIGYNWSGINADWTFSAQSIPHYKCFLRMRFEPEKLTIYPIGLDTVPVTRKAVSGWRVRRANETGRAIVRPKRPIEPRIIEGPIEIRTSDVRNFPRKA